MPKINNAKVRDIQQKVMALAAKRQPPAPAPPPQDDNFAIISENCWGGHIYERILKRPYNTPFVGLFIMPPCYLKILHNLRWYLSQPLTFLDKSKYGLRKEKYPVGCLHDVEIQFLHYKSREEALEKWTRRLARLPTDDRLLIEFSDHFNVTDAQLEEFDKLPFLNKVCFVAKQRPNLINTVWMSECTGDHVPNLGSGWRKTLKYFDINRVMCKSK